MSVSPVICGRTEQRSDGTDDGSAYAGQVAVHLARRWVNDGTKCTCSQWIVGITQFGRWGRWLRRALFNLYRSTLLKLTWVEIGIKWLRVKSCTPLCWPVVWSGVDKLMPAILPLGPIHHWPIHRPPPLVGPVGPVVFLVHFAPDCGRFATFVKLVAYLYICISL